MARQAQVVRMLGGPKILGRSVVAERDIIELIRCGLPAETLESVRHWLNLSQKQLAKYLALSSRTLARQVQLKRLSADKSDRVYRLARVATRAEAVLGSREKAVSWLGRANRALGNEIPLSLLDTDLGARQVEEILGRIETGIYS